MTPAANPTTWTMASWTSSRYPHYSKGSQENLASLSFLFLALYGAYAKENLNMTAKQERNASRAVAQRNRIQVFNLTQENNRLGSMLAKAQGRKPELTDVGSAPYPWQDKALMTSLFNMNLKAIEVATKLGCSAATVCRWRARYGLIKPKNYTEPSVLLKARIKDRLSDRAIAKKLGCSHMTIIRHRHAYGIDDSLRDMFWDGDRKIRGIRKNNRGRLPNQVMKKKK